MKKRHKLDETYAAWRESGSPDLFLAEVNRYAYRRVIMKVKDHGHAEDVAADATLYVWRNMPKFNPALSVIGVWVRLTIDSKLNDFLEAKYKRAGNVEYDPNDPELYTSENSTSQYARLRECFGDDKSLLDLLLAGHSLTECESLLGLSRMAVRHKMNTAKVIATKLAA